ncbi:MAG: rhodanese-like domain-containing protein [Candidatus Obscuribacter sp.]|nr:rhodanese-like domain-containing protein [Candidatus Obscuribacter sp.]MBK9278514.1 rhodanese-like domain-containing protein [Candidatus Obscuribacter sp.]MBL8082504.1 rhodanese-like domain-containing protein [Candidatus Obscuribacter sp.]
MSETANAAVCPQLAAKEAAGLKDLVIVDVRSPIEFECEHIDGAINIPLDTLEARIEEVPRKGQLLVVCRSGKRAERGAYALMGRAFQPKILAGGMLAWRQAGMPVIEGRKRLSIERQIQLVVGTGVLSGVLLGAFVNPLFLILPGFFGAGLTFAGLSGTCALGILLSKAPWNKLEAPVSASQCKKSGCCN